MSLKVFDNKELINVFPRRITALEFRIHLYAAGDTPISSKAIECLH